MLRSVGAVGTFVLGLHEKRKKVNHPGLQHVGVDAGLLIDVVGWRPWMASAWSDLVGARSVWRVNV